MLKQERLKIENVVRIQRLITRVCQAHLQILLRPSLNEPIAVRGKVLDESYIQSGEKVLRITEISEQGLRYLERFQKVQVEFIMTSARVVFVAPVVSRGFGCVALAMPKVLFSIDRRKHARFRSVPGVLAYLQFNDWDPELHNAGAMPVFVNYQGIKNHLYVADVSLSGFCIKSRFPGVRTVVQRGHKPTGHLIFPLVSPIPVSFDIRWVKNQKQLMHAGTDAEHYDCEFSFGCEIIKPSEELKLQLRQLITKIAKAEAI